MPKAKNTVLRVSRITPLMLVLHCAAYSASIGVAKPSRTSWTDQGSIRSLELRRDMDTSGSTVAVRTNQRALVTKILARYVPILVHLSTHVHASRSTPYFNP